MSAFPKRRMLRTLGTVAIVCVVPVTRAQGAWPNRPIRMIIPFPAGGTADALGRLLSQRLADALGQAIVPSWTYMFNIICVTNYILNYSFNE